MVGGTRSATHFIVSPSTYQPAPADTQTHTRARTQSAQTITCKTHGNTHTLHKLTSRQTQIDIEAGISPRGVNVNICPCHTHKDEVCMLVRPHVWQCLIKWNRGRVLLCFFKLCFPKVGGFYDTTDTSYSTSTETCSTAPIHSAVWAVCKGQKRNQFHPDKCK